MYTSFFSNPNGEVTRYPTRRPLPLHSLYEIQPRKERRGVSPHCDKLPGVPSGREGKRNESLILRVRKPVLLLKSITTLPGERSSVSCYLIGLSFLSPGLASFLTRRPWVPTLLVKTNRRKEKIPYRFHRLDVRGVFSFYSSGYPEIIPRTPKVTGLIR